jgi:hypothetical protein
MDGLKTRQVWDRPGDGEKVVEAALLIHGHSPREML